MNDLIGATKQRSSEKVLHAMQTILQMLENDESVNFYTVSAAAGVSRPFCTAARSLRNKIEDCRMTGMTKRKLQQEIILFLKKISYSIRPQFVIKQLFANLLLLIHALNKKNDVTRCPSLKDIE